MEACDIIFVAFPWNQSFTNANDPRFFKIIHIPCLCHRIHNSYSYHAFHNDNLTTLVQHIHDISKLCRQHIEDIGAICPPHVSTRWLYDYDIIAFILASNKTPLSSAYIWLQRAIGALYELSKATNNDFAPGLAASLENYESYFNLIKIAEQDPVEEVQNFSKILYLKKEQLLSTTYRQMIKVKLFIKKSRLVRRYSI